MTGTGAYMEFWCPRMRDAKHIIHLDVLSLQTFSCTIQVESYVSFLIII